MAVRNRRALFAYKTAKGALHRAPAALKLLALIPLSLLCMSLPLPALALGIAVTALAGLACKFSLYEQLADLRPVLFYSVVMYILSVFSQLAEIRCPAPVRELLMTVFTPQDQFLHTCLRLCVIVQLSALLFRTTTSLEIRDNLNAIEHGIRRALSRVPLIQKHISLRPRLSGRLALFAGFIPEIFQIWTQIDRAWRARGGKPGLAKIKTLVFVLITVSFAKTAAKADAMSARGG
jgi:biotin transport system permease protein/energy-coupling factor transport system permease protein